MKKLLVICAIVAGFMVVNTQAEDAKANYEKQCAKCHGPDGKGDTKMGKKLAVKDYSDAKVQGAMKDDAAFKSLKEGMKDKEGKVLMKPVEGMSDDDIKALVKYMRTFKK
jgi:cytochrome c553